VLCSGWESFALGPRPPVIAVNVKIRMEAGACTVVLIICAGDPFLYLELGRPRVSSASGLEGTGKSSQLEGRPKHSIIWFPMVDGHETMNDTTMDEATETTLSRRRYDSYSFRSSRTYLSIASPHHSRIHSSRLLLHLTIFCATILLLILLLQYSKPAFHDSDMVSCHCTSCIHSRLLFLW